MYLSCLRFLIRTVTKNGVSLLLLTLLAVFFALPSIVPSETGAFRFSAAFIKENRLEPLSSAVASGAYDTAPPNITDANERQLALLQTTQGDDVAASLKAQAEIAEIDLKLYESGNLTGDGVALEATAILLKELANLDDPDLYEFTTEEPALYRLAELFGSVPPLLLFVPPVAIAYAVFRAIEEDRLGFQLPVSRLTKVVLAFAAVLIMSCIGFAVALLPGCIISIVRNGVGDPSYPVVLIQAGSVVRLTVLSALARLVSLWFVVTLFTSLVSAFFFTITGGSVPGCFISLALGFVPSIPQYFSETFIAHDVLRYLPTTYLYVAPVGGCPSYINAVDTFPVMGASWEFGIGVLLVCSTALVLLIVGSSFIKKTAQPVGGRADA